MYDNLKSEIKKLYELCDSYEWFWRNEIKTRQSFRESLRWGLFFYLLYLSASDGVLKQAEVDFINECLKNQFSISEVKELAEDGGMADFASQPAPAFSIFARIDLASKSKGTPTYHAERLLTLYQNLGLAFIACDNEHNEQEMANYTNYIAMLEGCLMEHGLYQAFANSEKEL